MRGIFITHRKSTYYRQFHGILSGMLVLLLVLQTILAGVMATPPATGGTGHDYGTAAELEALFGVLELRKQDLGFVTQFLHCLPRKSAVEVVAEPLVQRGSPREAAAERARELLALLNVPERLWAVPPATFL